MLAYVIEDAGCRTVVSAGDLLDRLPDPASVLDTEDPRVTGGPATKPPERVRAENAACLIYTSGSTGEPKGVVNIHRALARYLRSIQADFPLGPEDRMLQKAPWIVDIALREILWPLTAGARLHLVPPDAHRDPQVLVDLVRRHGITVLSFVPSMLPFFLGELGELGCPSLRQVSCGGEPLPRALQRRFHQRLPGVSLLNSYGPAEAAIATVSWTLDPRDERPAVPIGRGVANTSTYLLDSRGRAVPLGAVGELHLAGEQLARGYLGRSRQTAESFVPAPLGGRLYRTGDLARHRGDGVLLFLGRRDLQAKVRGMRVEPGEIEAVLRRHPAVGDAAVVVREEEGNRRLLAFTVVDEAFRRRNRGLVSWGVLLEDLESVCRQLEAGRPVTLPAGRGIGYGRLRYLEVDPRIRQRMASLPQPEVSFNYMGRLDRILPRRADSLFTYADESCGPPRSRRGRFRHALTIGGGIVDGRLSLKWTYSRSSYRRSTVEELVHGFLRRLEALVESGD